jgi:hypothetical protein
MGIPAHRHEMRRARGDDREGAARIAPLGAVDSHLIAQLRAARPLTAVIACTMCA